MAVHSFTCQCGHAWDAFTGVIYDPDAERCPQCGEIKPKRLIGSIAKLEIYDSKNMEPGEIRMALRHRQDIEQGVARGEMEFKPGKMREFEPQFARRIY